MKPEPTLNRLSRVVGLFNGCLETVGVFMLLLIFVVNCADIIGSNFFSFPFPGVTEIVGYFHAIAIAFSVGITYVVRQHIRMEILVDAFPKPVQSVISRVVSLVILGLFMIIAWEVFKLGLSYQLVGEVSGTLRMPIQYFAYGVAFGFLGICLTISVELIDSLYQRLRK